MSGISQVAHIRKQVGERWGGGGVGWRGKPPVETFRLAVVPTQATRPLEA